MKTAFTTAELLEPMPRSVLLATLTNNLPGGVSLLKLNIVQTEPKQTSGAMATNQYQAAQAKKAEAQSQGSPEKSLETRIDIEGIAPSDLQVAAYIEQLSNSTLMSNVALVESKEHAIEGATFRQFKLNATLKKDAHLTKEDIEKIRAKAETTVWNF
jgi:Tfp pilus assembly protein PilN